MLFALAESMPSIKEKVQTGLDETRTLILGAEVLLGFQYSSVFQDGFADLPDVARYLRVVGLALTIVTVICLMAPAPFHQIVERGRDTERVHNYTTVMVRFGLLPFALSLGIDLFIVVARVNGIGLGIAIGIFTFLVALFFWYGLEFYFRSKRGKVAMDEKQEEWNGEVSQEEKTPLKDRVQHVLTEARVVLPGAQALLGFQFVAMVTRQFEELPELSKYVHLASLAMIAVTTIILMSPAAYHRIVDRGEDTEHFHHFAGRMVLAAMVPLALGISADIYVVAEKIFNSEVYAALAALVILLGFFSLWFLLPLQVRSRIAAAKRREAREVGRGDEIGEMR